MKTINYILILLLLSSCSSAQNYKLIEATHHTQLGGVIGSRTEVFTIILKNNSKLKVKNLLAGNVKIPLIIESKNGISYLKGYYLPENPNEITLDDISNPNKKNESFDLNNVYLISEIIKSKKNIKQKLVFTLKKENENIFKEDVPQ